jgi:ABC-2 type transport system ATP-binding protein
LIEAENLTKYYGSFHALKDVSFKVGQKEIVGFLGPNGAGKTTTMRIITGFIPPNKGTARIAGFDVLKESVKARQKIGYLPESVPLYRDMTVKAMLKFFASIRGMPRRNRDKRIKEVMGICRVDMYADTQIGKLSKGYRQLVGVAQAVLHEPDVLILDEPTIGIDPRQVVQIRQLIKDLGKEHTVILSSHILPEISMICERVIILDKGEIVAQDSTEGLSERLGGSQKIEIEVTEASEKIKEALGKIEGVFKVTSNINNNKNIYVVECAPGQDVREELASAIVSGGHSLLGLKTKEMSLEDIFLKVTTREKG